MTKGREKNRERYERQGNERTEQVSGKRLDIMVEGKSREREKEEGKVRRKKEGWNDRRRKKMGREE